MSILVLGFFLGIRHATDADHIIAVSTIVARQRRVGTAAWIGILWGVGHSLTILAVGGAIIFFGLVIPPRLGLTMEFSVALMLVLLGLLNLTGALRWTQDSLGADGRAPERLHSHAHRHDDYIHSHRHGHGPDEHGHADDRTPQAWAGPDPRRARRLPRGSSGRDRAGPRPRRLGGHRAPRARYRPRARVGIAYLLVFGAGTVAGMMLITAALAVPVTYAAGRFVNINRHLATVSGLLSLAVGLVIAYQVGFVEGLFTGHPQWTPE